LDPAVEGRRQVADQRMPDAFLDVCDHLPGVAFKPIPIEVFSDETKLDNEVPRQVLGLGFAALFPPKPEQGGFVRTYDGPGVRAADECCRLLSFDRSSTTWPIVSSLRQ